jgi:preprotein translocase SecF subunit
MIKEAEQLKQIMDAGSLPATLQSEPISVENISPDMGADNITAGIRSSFIAVSVVILFMLVLYTITGAFADIALMLNLVLVLATMAMVQGTFTLPGIAGLVLTLGMAVDANVLINERIREELHRGASLWMAVKQGYDRVFWTIFDSNLTTALTSVVLIFVGTEEVKGFGVTLLIGLVIQFFTALYVTRTFMMAAVKWGIVRAVDDHSIGEYLKELLTFTWLRRGHFPFMRVITVTNFDWIGKRHFFWGLSAVVMVAGLIAFIARGEDKYDIEFRGGTQVTFQLKNPLANVEQSLVSLAADTDVTKAYPDLKNLAQSLKEASTLAKREELVKAVAAQLAADSKVVQAHPEVKEFQNTIQRDLAAQKDLTLDEVREMVTSLHAKSPALKEMSNARVYSVGTVSDRRYQMQTTIANAPQEFEKTLPEPLTKALGGNLKDLSIRHDSSATFATFTLLPVNNSYPTEQQLLADIQGLKNQPGMQDLDAAEVTSIGKLQDHRIQVTIPNLGIRKVLLEPLANEFKDYLEIKPKVTFKNENEDARDALDTSHTIVPINAPTLQEVFAKTPYTDMPLRSLTNYSGGAAIVIDDLKPAISADQLYQRIGTIRRSSEFSGVPSRDYAVWPITVLDSNNKPVPAASETDARPMVRGVVLTVDPAHRYQEDDDNMVAQWRNKIATTEWKILHRAASMEDLFEGVTSFDAVVAAQAKIRALIAIIFSLVLIVIYVWVRFGGIRYGFGAILSLAHDAIVALAATVLSGVVYDKLFHRHSYLLLSDFKINLTMIAAYLTVIGYSVNDTIVIFDRVRENRGKSRQPLTPKLINDAINQCFGRTIWTTFTVFIVVLIMYIWGGEGVRGFSFAMLIGVFTGAYSTLAIASPMLLATGTADSAPRGPNPFTRKKSDKRELPEPEESEEPESDEPQTAR